MTIIDLKDEIFQLKSEGKTWNEIDSLLNLNPDQARNLARNDPRYSLIKKSNPHSKPDEMDKKYYRDDGSITSIIRTKRKNKQTFNQNELLTIHGFNPDEFKIRSITSNEWTTPISGESFYNYQSKITVEPITKTEINLEQLTDILKSEVKPLKINSEYTGETNLVIQLADIHFGITKLSDALPKLSNLKSRVELGYDTIVIEQLGDLFHSSQMRSSQTLKGTILDDVNMEQAVSDARLFYDAVIRMCLENSNEVIIEHACGNHSGNMEYMFLVYLETKYPQVKVNYHNEPRSVYRLGNVGIMLSHGDTVPLKRLPMLFATEHKLLWAECETVEVHTAHKHNKFTEEEYDGVILRQAPTFKPNDTYEIQNGWTNARKFLQVIEYEEDGEVGSYVI